MAFALLVVLPSVAASAQLHGTHAASSDQSLAALMVLMFGPTMLALGTAAPLASLMAGFAGNVSGFFAV